MANYSEPIFDIWLLINRFFLSIFTQVFRDPKTLKIPGGIYTPTFGGSSFILI